MIAILESLWSLLTALLRRAGRVLRRLGCGCLLLVLLLVAALVVLAVLLVDAASAQGGPSIDRLALYFLSDESVSMSEPGGDPGRLRADAVRMMVQYLGLEEGVTGVGADSAYAAALIAFGTTPQLLTPLTSLDPAGRAALLALLAAPPEPLGWTDPLAALALARGLAADAGDRRPVVILLTDGIPEWDATIGPPPGDAYAAALRAEAAQLADLGATLFVVLLADESADPAPAIDFWRGVWLEMVSATPGGHLYDAHQPTDLPAVYHDIVAVLAGYRPSVAAQSVLAGETVRHIVPVEPDLARLTLVVDKSTPDITVEVFLPDGRPLTSDSFGGIGYNAGPTEAIWAVDDPPSGDWTVVLSGAGSVTVWKDVRFKPAPTATVAPTPMSSATATVISTPTRSAAVALLTPSPLAATAILVPVAPKSEMARPSSPWLSIAVGGVVVALALAALHRKGQQPTTAGMIRPLDATVPPIDLDALHRHRLILGAPPADVLLPGFAARFEIVPGRVLGDGHAMWLRAFDPDPAAPILINGRPLAGDHALKDMDVIACGPVTLRYENLWLRPDPWAEAQDDEFLTTVYE